MSPELCNRPHSLQSICGSVAEHQSAECEGQQFHSSWGLRIFSLSYAHIKTKTIFLYFSTELKTYHLSNCKHDAIEITDPSNMNFVIDFAHFRVSVAQWQHITVQNPKFRGLIPCEHISTFVAIFHKYIQFFWLGSIFKQTRPSLPQANK